MATAGHVSVAVTEWNELWFDWSLSSQSIVDNSSIITWSLTLQSGSYGRIDSTAPKTWSVTINGINHSGECSVGISNNSFKTLVNGTTVIWHDDDGSKTFSFSFEQEFSIVFDGASIGTVGGSGSDMLPDIPKASSLTVSGGTLGVTQTITITRRDNSLMHGLTYSCGSVKTQLICPWNTTAETISFTPPIDLAWQAVNGNRVWVDIHLQTYRSDGTPIGNTISQGVWMNIPDSIKPSCTVVVSDPMGWADKYGAYIQGQSTMSIKVAPKTSYGSAITRYAVTADGKSFATAEAEIPVIQSTGTLTINASVTDTRGRSGSTSATVTVLPYTKPVINMLKVHRCNEDGTENDRGLYAKVTYAYAIDALGGKNGMSAYIQYKKITETEYTSAELPEAFVVTDGTFIFAAGDDSPYNVELRVADDMVSVDSRTTVSTPFSLIHYAPSGKGITFGSIRNTDAFNIVDLPFRINDVDVDYIVEQGESDGWFYRKWNGGYAECWKIYYGQVDSGKTNYSGFYYSETVTVPFPFTFTNLPTVTVDGGSVTYMNFVRVFGKYSDKASFNVVSMTDAGNVDVTVDIKVIGKWK